MATKPVKNNPYMKMVVNILHVGNMIDKKMGGVLKNYEITHTQFNVLRILELEYPKAISLAEVTDALFFHTSDVSRLIERLVKRELISRKICPQNRRKIDIAITEKGLGVIDECIPRISDMLDGFFEDKISENERDAMSRALKKLKLHNK